MHVEQKVKLLLQRYQTNCPFALARHLRLHVRFKPLPRHIRGFYCRISGQRFIVIDEALPFIWKRFVCAHELGHDQLHRGMSYYYHERRSRPVGSLEREANRFAVTLLTAYRTKFEWESDADFFLRIGIPVEITRIIR